MKPFNLEEALKGAPVKLCDGTKAFVLKKLTTKLRYCLIGFYEKKGEEFLITWDVNGCSNYPSIDNANIVGMWEEPELTQEQILEKAYNWIKCSEQLPETFTGFDLLIQSVPCLVYGLYSKNSEKPGIFGAKLFGDKWHSVDGECYKVTHWMPFPEPPED